MTDQLEAGPELDAAVAEAIFDEATASLCATSGCIDLPMPKDGTDPDVMAIWKHPDHGRHWVSCPKYSTDLNAAFAAAEKCGLFSTYGCVLGMVHRAATPTWAVIAEVRNFDNYRDEKNDDLAYLPGDLVGEPIATGPTPAVAICRAILKVNDAHSPQ